MASNNYFPVPVGASELEARAKELLAGEKQVSSTPVVVDSSYPFEIGETDKEYFIRNVVCQNEVYDLSLLKKHLAIGTKRSFWERFVSDIAGNAECRNANSWTQYSKESFPLWRVVRVPFHFGMYNTLYQNRLGKYADIINRVVEHTLRPVLMTSAVATSSRVHHGRGLDEIIHDFGLPAEKRIAMAVNGFMLHIMHANTELVVALTGLDNAAVNTIATWIDPSKACQLHTRYGKGKGTGAVVHDSNVIYTDAALTRQHYAFGIRIISQAQIGGAQ